MQGSISARTAVGAVVSVVVLVMATWGAGVAYARKKSKRKRADDAAHVLTMDLSSLELDGDPTFTISLPPDLWRAHQPRMTKYPRKNQLSGSFGRRVASRWLQATHDDGRAFDSQVFFVVEPASLGTVRDWARRIAYEPDTVFPFEDSHFDGRWIVNAESFRVAGKKRLRGIQLENSGGRTGESYRSVYQFALLPMPGDINVLLGVKREAPTSWAPGKGGPPNAGNGAGAGIGDGGGLGSSGEGTGSLPDSGGEGDGSLGDGVGAPGDVGNVNTEPDGNQVRASSELIRSLIAGVQLTETKKMRKGERRFQLRDEWDSPQGLTSRYVGISVPATWRSTPTTALQGDRIEWRELGDDGELAAIARVEFLKPRPPTDLTAYARARLEDWGVRGATFVSLETSDDASTAVMCESAITAPRGLRAGDDKSWVREIAYVKAKSTLYEIEIVRSPDAPGRLDTLRKMLESVNIFVAY